MQPWDPQPGEPPRWYARFEHYRLLGASRSLEAAYRRAAEIEALKGNRPGASWYEAARRWQWDQRAQAWDAVERERLRTLEQDRRFDAREGRLTMIRQLLGAVYSVLIVANLPTLDIAEARQMLPLVRLLFKDLLTQERAELGLPIVQDQPAAGGLTFTADDYIEAQRQLEAHHQRIDHHDEQEEGVGNEQTLLVVVGPDPALHIDVAMLRAVSAETGINIKVLPDCTAQDLDHHLQRVRSVGRPVRWLQMSCHMTPTEIVFRGGPVDGNWLSQRLLGVEVLLLAGCTASDLGDWLQVVPRVISFGADVEHRAAGWFVRAFWTEIARGHDADHALASALDRSAPVMREWVERHW